ncbi:hypothetical protein [Methylobacterium trifolii]|uniref:DUF2474 domain-containing protein n=1 Tax=Methylobacterium trifolii TaxID=1003092 RepID=A0ABQ4U198_9HYPH|nr:hypothetical protein [Methylobacterium trifolii]GJE60917.1 hypothetical protein MPOCJGCO_3036 [Methylobacterium trifolii]
MSRRGAEGPRPKDRLLWFVGVYALSLTTFAALVYLLRAIVRG